MSLLPYTEFFFVYRMFTITPPITAKPASPPIRAPLSLGAT